MDTLVRTLHLAGLFESAQLQEAKDPAPQILAAVATGLRKIGFSKNSVADTPGVKRQWLIQKKMKFDFKTQESFDQFMTELKAALPDLTLKGEKHYRDYEIRGEGFSIATQNDDEIGQVVISVPKKNKSGDLYNSGIDA